MSTRESEPLISVLMVNRNHEDTVGEAIESVLGQTYAKLRLIVVDDGSTDGSLAVIERYLKDPRVELHALRENVHICRATNYGLERVTGEWLARIDSDDVWRPTRLERQLQVLAEHPGQDICFTWADWIDERGNDCRAALGDFARTCDAAFSTQREWLRMFYYEGNCLLHSSVLLRTSLMRETGGFELSYRMLHDFDYWVRVAKRHNLLVVPERLIAMRHFVGEDNEGRHSSEQNDENDTRSFNEYADIRAHFFDGMPNDVLIDAFGEDFRRADSRSPDELACERAFLLCRPQLTWGGCVPAAGLRALKELFARERTRALLEERYGFTVHDLYELTARHTYFDIPLQRAWAEEREHLHDQIVKRDARIEELDWRIVDLNRELAELRAKKDELEAHIRAMEGSSSWRLTRPLRSLSASLHSSAPARAARDQRAEKGAPLAVGTDHPTVCVHAFLAANLGDDLFVRMLCARYPYVTFQVAATPDYRERLADVANLEVHDQADFPALVRAADAVAHIGGCCFVQHGADFSRFYETDRFLADNARHLVFLGGNFGPYTDDSYLAAYRELFRRYDGLTFRDRYSAGLFEGYPNVAYAPDIVFGYPARTAEKRPKAVFAPIRMEGREGTFGIAGHAEAYRRAMVGLARELVGRGYEICLVSFCQGQGDEQACSAIAAALTPGEREHVRRVWYQNSVEDVVREFEDAECVVATRFHAMVLGFAHGCRVLPVVYDQKTQKVLEDLAYPLALRLEDLGSADAGVLADELLSTEPLDAAPLAAASEGHFQFLDRVLGR